MGISTNVDESKDLKQWTLISIIGTVVIVLVFLVGVIFYLINNNINLKAAKIFETGYLKVLDLDKQTNVYSKQEMAKEIIPILDEVIGEYPSSSSARRALFYKGYVSYYTEEYEKAEKVLKYFIEKYPNDYLVEKAYYFLSFCYEGQGKPEDAINSLKIFDNKLKNSYYASISFYRLANLYEKKSDIKNALEYYQKIVDLKDNTSQKENAKKKILLLKNDIKL